MNNCTNSFFFLSDLFLFLYRGSVPNKFGSMSSYRLSNPDNEIVNIIN
jgi:hypothetical protein